MAFEPVVFVGPIGTTEGAHLGVLSAAAAHHHWWFTEAVQQARTYGQVRAVPFGPLAQEDPDDYESGELPGDDAVFDIDRDPHTEEGEWDCTVEEAVATQWAGLLGDLGVPDDGWGISYPEADFVLPVTARAQVVDRLTGAGWAVVGVPDLMDVWFSRPPGFDRDQGQPAQDQPGQR